MGCCYSDWKSSRARRLSRYIIREVAPLLRPVAGGFAGNTLRTAPAPKMRTGRHLEGVLS